ncbi:MAG: hypothetical protein AAB682_01380 [Patescibacteria group bacterium]
MKTFSLIISYLRWHYSDGVKSVVRIWKDIIWFAYHFFSVPILMEKLWYPLGAEDLLREDAEATRKIAHLLFKFILRFMGIISRIILLIISVCVILLLIFSGPLIFSLWVLLPITAVFLMILGVLLLFL